MYLQRIAAVTLAIILCLAALVTTNWNLKWPLPDPAFARSLLDEPSRTFLHLGSELSANGFDISEEYTQKAVLAAQRDPLSDAAFLVGAIRSNNAGRYREGLIRLEHARKRNPRNRLTRVMLFEAYLREARAGEAVIEAAVLDRLGAGATQALLPQLASLAQNPSTRKATAQALGNSVLEYRVLSALAERQVSPEMIMSFAGRAPTAPMLDDNAKQQINGLIDPYLKAGRWKDAAQLWAHFHTRRPADAEQVVDADFTGDTAPPFGWSISRSDGGVAETGGAGLEVTHFGRKPWVVARQALLLTPSTYRLSYKIGSNPPNLPDLAWRLDCAGTGVNLLDLPFLRENFLGIEANDIITIPETNCPAQWLVLAARVGDTSETRSVTIRSVEISRLGEE